MISKFISNRRVFELRSVFFDHFNFSSSNLKSVEKYSLSSLRKTLVQELALSSTRMSKCFSNYQKRVERRRQNQIQENLKKLDSTIKDIELIKKINPSVLYLIYNNEEIINISEEFKEVFLNFTKKDFEYICLLIHSNIYNYFVVYSSYNKNSFLDLIQYVKYLFWNRQLYIYYVKLIPGDSFLNLGFNFTAFQYFLFVNKGFRLTYNFLIKKKVYTKVQRNLFKRKTHFFYYAIEELKNNSEYKNNEILNRLILIDKKIKKKINACFKFIIKRCLKDAVSNSYFLEYLSLNSKKSLPKKLVFIFDVFNQLIDDLYHYVEINFSNLVYNDDGSANFLMSIWIASLNFFDKKNVPAIILKKEKDLMKIF